ERKRGNRNCRCLLHCRVLRYAPWPNRIRATIVPVPTRRRAMRAGIEPKEESCLSRRSRTARRKPPLPRCGACAGSEVGNGGAHMGGEVERERRAGAAASPHRGDVEHDLRTERTDLDAAAAKF